MTGLPREWKIGDLAREIAQTGATLRKPRTGKFTLMALGDNDMNDLQPLVEHYDLLIASHSVGTDVIAAFPQRNPGASVF